MLGLGIARDFPSAEAQHGGWRVGSIDTESELCSLRAALETTQRSLVQLEGKLATRVEQYCRRQIEDALANAGSTQELKQGVSRLQSECRHLGLELGRLPSARDIDSKLEQHRTAVDGRLGERVDALEHNLSRQHQQLVERLEGNGGETWRVCLQRMSALEERAVLQTDVARIVERSVAEVRRAGPELLGIASAPAAEVRSAMRRLEAKVAGCEARLCGLSEESSSEGRVWRASVAAKVEALERAGYDTNNRLVGCEAGRAATEERTRQLGDSLEDIQGQVKLAEAAVARVAEAEKEVMQLLEATVQEKFDLLDSRTRQSSQTLRRDLEAAQSRLQERLEAAATERRRLAGDQASVTDGLASLRAEVAQLAARSKGMLEQVRDPIEKDLERKLTELRHGITVKLAGTSGSLEAQVDRIATAVSGYDRRIALSEQQLADVAEGVARLGAAGRSQGPSSAQQFEQQRAPAYSVHQFEQSQAPAYGAPQSEQQQAPAHGAHRFEQQEVPAHGDHQFEQQHVPAYSAPQFEQREVPAYGAPQFEQQEVPAYGAHQFEQQQGAAYSAFPAAETDPVAPGPPSLESEHLESISGRLEHLPEQSMAAEAPVQYADARAQEDLGAPPQPSLGNISSVMAESLQYVEQPAHRPVQAQAQARSPASPQESYQAVQAGAATSAAVGIAPREAGREEFSPTSQLAAGVPEGLPESSWDDDDDIFPGLELSPPRGPVQPEPVEPGPAGQALMAAEAAETAEALGEAAASSWLEPERRPEMELEATIAAEALSHAGAAAATPQQEEVGRGPHIEEHDQLLLPDSWDASGSEVHQHDEETAIAAAPGHAQALPVVEPAEAAPSSGASEQRAASHDAPDSWDASGSEVAASAAAPQPEQQSRFSSLGVQPQAQGHAQQAVEAVDEAEATFDDADLAMEVSASWDASGGSRAFDHVPDVRQQEAPPAALNRAPAALQTIQPAPAPVPVAAAAPPESARARGGRNESARTIMSDLGLDSSDEVPSDNDWDD